MKSNEFLREIQKKGWVFIRRGKGSHIIFEKNCKQESVPLHESKEMGKGLEMKLRKGMGI
ncbi:MAG: type II toxin-antitoxin system HicA family toxin [Chitinophagaceae bacterium]|nr:type II toxin-antitoxin system HicA family toxin [Chitinophagaceae bacterium]